MKSKKYLNKDFENICDWFLDKYIDTNYIHQINIRYSQINIKQHSLVISWVRVRRDNIGEPVALKIINKTNGKLKFLYRKNRYLTKEFRRLLLNALIQPHFDCAYPACYPNLNEKMKKKIQIIQNKCIRFCLKVGLSPSKKIVLFT